MSQIEEAVRTYYTGKIETHGASHKGADWNSTESQELRFDQLLKVCSPNGSFSLNDLGCGYGALYEYAADRFENLEYFGYDICPEMIQSAKTRLANQSKAHLIDGADLQMADFTVASGIFHVKLKSSNEDWLKYILDTVDKIDKASSRGYSFNLLTSYSDKERMRDDLFYADPCFFFDYLKLKYSRNVAVLHDYGLWEFTMIVRKL